MRYYILIDGVVAPISTSTVVKLRREGGYLIRVAPGAWQLVAEEEAAMPLVQPWFGGSDRSARAAVWVLLDAFPRGGRGLYALACPEGGNPAYYEIFENTPA